MNAGANSINGVSFYVDDTASLYEEARIMASDRARNKAEQLADNFDVIIGEITSISEWTNYYPTSGMAYDNYGGGLGYYAESPPVTPGAYSITSV